MAVGVLAAGITLFWRMVLPRAGSGGLFGELMRVGESADPLLGFLLSPLWLLASLFLAVAVVHLFLLVFGGAHRGFATTLRVFCLAYGPQLFVIVPVAGSVIGGVWMTALAIVGLKHAHGTSGGRAAAAVLLPLVVLLLFGMLATMALLLGRGQL